MDENREQLSVLQSRTACDVVIQKYDYLVEHVNAVRIFPHLVASGLVEQDFLQYLDGERTDKDKMMALLREVTKCPQESWFDRFTNALSKVPQYEEVASDLLGEFTQLMSERLTHPPPPADQRKWAPRLRACTRSTSEPSLVVNVTNNVSGVDGVCTMQKIVDNAEAGHTAALLELQKANARVLEAEKSKIYAEAEKSALEEKVKLLGKLAEVEMHNQLLIKESQTYKVRAEEKVSQRLEMENTQLSRSLAEVRLQKETAREKLQVMEKEKEALERKVASRQAEMEESRREKEVEVASLEQQLSDAREWQQREEVRFKEELGCLQSQLEGSGARVTTLEGELVEARGRNERLEQEMKKLKEELDVVIADRGRLKVNYHQAVNEVDGVRTELAKVKSELTEVHSLRTRLGSKAEGKENKPDPSNRGHSNHDGIVTNAPRSQPRHYPPMDGHNLAVSSIYQRHLTCIARPSLVVRSSQICTAIHIYRQTMCAFRCLYIICPMHVCVMILYVHHCTLWQNELVALEEQLEPADLTRREGHVWRQHGVKKAFRVDEGKK